MWKIPTLVSICLKNGHQRYDFWKFWNYFKVSIKSRFTDFVIKQIYAYAVPAWCSLFSNIRYKITLPTIYLDSGTSYVRTIHITCICMYIILLLFYRNDEIERIVGCTKFDSITFRLFKLDSLVSTYTYLVFLTEITNDYTWVPN